MKINKLIFKILFLYFSIFSVLFLAFYLLMPFSFNFPKNIIIFSNIIISTIILLISIFLIRLKIKNCNFIYLLCKNIPFTIYLINIIISIFIIIIYKEKLPFILSLLSIFATTIFYIFSQIYFKNILDYSEKNYRKKTNDIAKIKNNFIFNFSLSTNLIFEIAPLIITTTLISLFLEKNISSLILVLSLILISILSIVYIAISIYKKISKITNKNINYSLYSDKEIGNLIFKINTTKKIYDDYINKLQDINNKELESERLSSIEILRRTVDAKDTYTRGHSDRVSEYCVLIGEKLGLSEDELNILRIGGLFHDIGKIGISDNILLKDGKLTDEEFAEIKKHPYIGAQILKDSYIFKDIIPLVLHHHEKFDGTGYPNNLKGEDIPFLARIVTVADTFDAMTSKRSYRNELSIDIVKNEFKKYSGTQFDPNIVKVFLNILDNDYEKIERIKTM